MSVATFRKVAIPRTARVPPDAHAVDVPALKTVVPVLVMLMAVVPLFTTVNAEPTTIAAVAFVGIVSVVAPAFVE